MPIPILMQVCGCRDFQMTVYLGFFSFVWKEGACCRDENIVWFFILFNAYQAFWRDFQLQKDKRYLEFTCSKLTIKTVEQDTKHVWSWNLKTNTPK